MVPTLVLALGAVRRSLLGAGGGLWGAGRGWRAAQLVGEVRGDFTGAGVWPPSGVPVNRWRCGLGVWREDHWVPAQLIEMSL